ncbi:MULTISPECIES: DUF177 domain-containing protein [unclassified Fusibacter]|uniref:YceD family protein n=1 Tax=unclassified Fusibacter TaxID=2624464 RepID=UPI00101236DD|nr:MULTISPECIES: DUF177 domain-containing protein [unclassified Fusibacter]MCK8058071.1 DUF177 domain-containing protein [Fusibacter sp. A2]NPE20653.1 DUF177 domain-containing protein [Fusibacter sp. A1]RXV62859.1 DUF177 domain-containing protein [Fusibacter sp. A1]
MQLDLFDLKQNRKKEISFEETLTFAKDMLIGHNVDSVEPFAVAGKVCFLDNKLYIHFHYEGMVHFVCDRCLSVFAYALKNEVSRELSELDEFDVDWLVIRDGKIDLTEALTDDILINLPIQLLCSENCEGLCPTCGANLNVESCECDNETIDPRLEGLKNFFN